MSTLLSTLIKRENLDPKDMEEFIGRVMDGKVPEPLIAGILVAVVLVPEMGILASIFAMASVGLGIAWYNLYVRHRVARVGAVAQLAERMAERLLDRDARALGLDVELREILKEKGLINKE